MRILPDSAVCFPLPFQIDHIVAENHGGETVADNLLQRSEHRGDGFRLWSTDPAVQSVAHKWTDHFFFFQHARLEGRTEVGRVTIHVLAMNAEELLSFRTELLEAGVILS
jgi:hypothetical protein